MKKLSKVELDVVVNEVVNNIKLIEENKCKEIFDKNESKELFLNKVKEIEELENKLDELKKNIKEVEDKFKEDNLRVYFNSKGNRGYGGNSKLYSVSLLEGKSNSYSLYKEIEKDIILKGIDDELNVKEFINGLIEKFK
jgi:predicted Zn-dependent protease